MTRILSDTDAHSDGTLEELTIIDFMTLILRGYRLYVRTRASILHPVVRALTGRRLECWILHIVSGAPVETDAHVNIPLNQKQIP